jgi:acetoin utilization deacetylase AcuC-like enzyme
MAAVKLVYSERYDLNLGDHVFPSVKYKLIHDKLIQEGIASESDFLEPQPATDQDVLLVHTEEYVRKLKTGTLSEFELARLEIPYSPEMVRAAWLGAGGSILAAREALGHGIAVNIGGGFHHAFPAHGEGFCAIHDVAIAISKLLAEAVIKSAMTVDLDVHQGNGTAYIFARNSNVFTFSMHQESNYPLDKPDSDCDINLRDGCQDEEYLHLLRENLHHSLSAFHPNLIFYLAGADPYCEDQLGGLSLTLQGLRERDRIVFAMARERGIPVAVTLAGGYARHVEDTVAIHVGTVRAAFQAVEQSS